VVRHAELEHYRIAVTKNAATSLSYSPTKINDGLQGLLQRGIETADLFEKFGTNDKGGWTDEINIE
jgi:hypothetical protein